MLSPAVEYSKKKKTPLMNERRNLMVNVSSSQVAQRRRNCSMYKEFVNINFPIEFLKSIKREE